MKSIFKSFLLLPCLMLPTLVQANDLEAALSSETAQFTFRSDSSLIGWGGAELGLGMFYNDVGDYVAQVSLMQRRQASQKNPLTLGVGLKAYLGELDNKQNIGAFALGGEIRYTIPGTMPMSVYLTAQYAPKITSFADSIDLLDTNLGFQIEIMPQTVAFIGYRTLEVDLDQAGPDYELDDDNVHIGVRLTF